MARVQRPSVRIWRVIIVLVALAVIVCVAMALLLKKPANVANFGECEKAGGTILTTYPEQCSIGGKTFTNTTSQHGDKGQAYVGLTESVALEKASAANIPARIVERDGKPLPVTMDYVLGRLNFYVKEGKVYKVNVEGESAS